METGNDISVNELSRRLDRIDDTLIRMESKMVSGEAFSALGQRVSIIETDIRNIQKQAVPTRIEVLERSFAEREEWLRHKTSRLNGALVTALFSLAVSLIAAFVVANSDGLFIPDKSINKSSIGVIMDKHFNDVKDPEGFTGLAGLAAYDAQPRDADGVVVSQSPVSYTVPGDECSSGCLQDGSGKCTLR